MSDSQCRIIGQAPPSSWDDYEACCIATFGGGYRTIEERMIFHHGMSTVFNLLRNEFPTAEQCKASPKLLVACKVLCNIAPPCEAQQRVRDFLVELGVDVEILP